MRPNNLDKAKARFIQNQASRPAAGTFIFDYHIDTSKLERVWEGVAIRRGMTFTNEQVLEALRGDGQEEYDMLLAAQDTLLVYCRAQEGLAAVWVVASEWSGEAANRLGQQMSRLKAEMSRAPSPRECLDSVLLHMWGSYNFPTSNCRPVEPWELPLFDALVEVWVIEKWWRVGLGLYTRVPEGMGKQFRIKKCGDGFLATLICPRGDGLTNERDGWGRNVDEAIRRASGK